MNSQELANEARGAIKSAADTARNDYVTAMVDRATVWITELEDDTRYLREKLARAAYVAEHLMQMIDQETWRASGGDDGQGHYEGDYHEAQLALEIKNWAELANDSNSDQA